MEFSWRAGTEEKAERKRSGRAPRPEPEGVRLRPREGKGSFWDPRERDGYGLQIYHTVQGKQQEQGNEQAPMTISGLTKGEQLEALKDAGQPLPATFR